MLTWQQVRFTLKNKANRDFRSPPLPLLIALLLREAQISQKPLGFRSLGLSSKSGVKAPSSLSHAPALPTKSLVPSFRPKHPDFLPVPELRLRQPCAQRQLRRRSVKGVTASSQPRLSSSQQQLRHFLGNGGSAVKPLARLNRFQIPNR